MHHVGVATAMTMVLYKQEIFVIYHLVILVLQA